MSNITVDARGDQCPIPVIKTKKALAELPAEGGVVEVLVDNEIAVQNLTKMANQKKLLSHSQKLGERDYQVVITVGAGEITAGPLEEPAVCIPDARTNMIAVVSSATMGTGNDELGQVLMKGFLYALSQLDDLPRTILFYNGGARLTTEGSDSLEDLKSMEAQGVEILTCGTCLNYYGLSEKLAVGGVTNMYTIVEKMAGAGKIIRP